MRIFAGLLVLLAGTAAHAATVVAFVTDLRGEAQVNGAKPVLLTELAEGQEIRVGEKSAIAVMFLRSGDEFALTGPGEYIVQKDSLVPRKGIAGGTSARRTTAWRPDLAKVVDISKSATASLRMRSIQVAPPATEAVPGLKPDNTRVATLNPVLAWTPLSGASDYEVHVAAGDETVYRGMAAKAEVKLPVRLKAGTAYRWTVKSGEKESAASFTTLSADDLKRAAAARPGNRSTFSDQLLYAITLQGLGATQEARELWRALSSQRPELPELAALAK